MWHVRAALGGRRSGRRQISGILGVLNVVEHRDRYQRGNGPTMTGENDAFVAVRDAVDHLAKLVAGFGHPDFSHLYRLHVLYSKEPDGPVGHFSAPGAQAWGAAARGYIASNPVASPMPPLNADERTTLEAWLEFHRATLAVKCQGLDDAPAATASAPAGRVSH